MSTSPGEAGPRAAGTEDPDLLGSDACAYDLLAKGSLAAVVDLEPDVWLQIENPTLPAALLHADIDDHDVTDRGGPGHRLLAAVDKALGELPERRTYTKLFAKYFPGHDGALRDRFMTAQTWVREIEAQCIAPSRCAYRLTSDRTARSVPTGTPEG